MAAKKSSLLIYKIFENSKVLALILESLPVKNGIYPKY